MEILIATIGIPALALVLFYLDQQRRHGLDRAARDFARSGIWWVSMLIFIHALLFGIWTLSPLTKLFFQPGAFLFEDALAIVLRAILVGFLVYAGNAALRVSNHAERDDLTLYQTAKRERDWDQMRVGEFILVALPLLVPGSFVLLFFAVFAAVGFSFGAITTRARQNRLLWTLALAAKHKLSFVDEINSFALTEKGKRRTDLLELAGYLSSGTSLSHALLTGKRLLPFEYAAAIQAAENNDSLDVVLPQLAIKHTERLRLFHVDSALNNIALYAFFVTAVILQVTGFIMYWIIPKYKQIFADFGVALPDSTNRLINASDYFINFGFVLIPLMMIPFLLLFAIAYLSLGPTRWTPRVFYRMFPRIITPQLLRTIAHVTEFDGSVPDTLKSLADFSSDQGWASRFHRLSDQLEQGNEVGKSLYNEELLYRREAHALNSAQELGHLPWALTAIADRIDRHRTNRFHAWAEWFKPIVILGLGLLVFLFAIAMFSPLVQLLNDLS